MHPPILFAARLTAVVLLVTALGCSRQDASAPTPVPVAPTSAAVEPAASSLVGAAPAMAPSPAPAGGSGLAWTLPSGWTESRPGGMRFASFKPNVPGNIDGSVIALPGPAGGELANVNRWRGQIGLEALDEAGLNTARRQVQSAAGPVAVFDFSSRGEPGKRVIAGIVATAGKSWFVKLTGDAPAIAAAEPAFLALLASLKP